MNVLADRHQADLWWSLHLLFEKRLGWKLYMPYGIDWYEKGYYRLYGDLSKKDPYLFLAKQYLVDTIYDGYCLESYFGCMDYPKPNLLTFYEFQEKPMDVIVCTVHENEPYFAKLKDLKPKAKFIRQVGNDLDTNVNFEFYPNLLSSAIAPYAAFKGEHKVLYRQEFDLGLFRYHPPRFFRNVYSFQNDLKRFEEAWEWWLRLEHNLKDFSFKSYGVGNDDGKIYPKREYVRKMLEASFIFQSKDFDGYGHVVHNAMALGRPMVVKEEHYKGRLAGELLEDGETCLFIDNDIEQKIKSFSRPEALRGICGNAHERFHDVVNFDEEFEKSLKPFMENLV